MNDSVVQLGAMTLQTLPDVDGLCEQAMASTGLSDWGTIPFREPLTQFLDSIRQEGDLRPDAVERLHQSLVASLCTRLQLEAAHKADSTLTAAPISAPIIILGLPRSGTTNLHSLLAQDPAHRVARTWEIVSPFPAARAEDYWTDPRIDSVQAFIGTRGLLADEIQAALPYHATSPAECGAIMDHAFMSQYRQASTRSPSWSYWRDHDADWRPAYAFHRRFLQHLQTHNKAERWLLKSPEHMVPADTVAETYPDATFIHTHRDPALVMGSVSSLVTALRRLGSDNVNPVEIGREQFEMWAHATEQTLAARDKWGEKRKVVDVHLADIARAPIETVEKVYDQIGIALSDEARSAMHAFVSGEEGAREHKHNYRSKYVIEDFGLSRDEIYERFGGYMQRFGITRGS